jgi:alcohol dehydrogenase
LDADNIAEDALELGAHVYIDTIQEHAAEKLQSMGGATAIITTIGSPAAISALSGGLAPQGRLVLLVAGKDPLPVSPRHLVVGERSMLGSLTGSPYENEKTLNFSVLTGVAR